MIDRFIDQWLPKFPQRQRKQTALLMWWKDQCGHLLLSDLSSAVLAECRDQLLLEITVRGKLRSPSTTNRYLSAIGKTLSVCKQEWGWIQTNPMENVAKPSEAPAKERFLSPDEKDRLLDACRESRNPNLLPLVGLALVTAMRFGELTGLSWRDVDFANRTITLHRTKNGETRVLPLTRRAEEIFKACSTYGSPHDELIFQSQRNQSQKKVTSVREAFRAATKRAGIEGVSFHTLRHSACSFLAMNGATLSELAEIMGHRTLQMVKRYSHFSQKHLRALMERAEGSLSNSKSLKEVL
ncbi:MAG TPA: site-specific integrase [Candidatus Aminicenantes bacterium]|nr:site-specific integrase [Candidatus Aminicenantes bacterium]